MTMGQKKKAVEAVARALCLKAGMNPDLSLGGDKQNWLWREYIRPAKAAIKAYKEVRGKPVRKTTSKPEYVLRHDHFFPPMQDPSNESNRVDACELENGTGYVWDVDQDYGIRTKHYADARELAQMIVNRKAV